MAVPIPRLTAARAARAPERLPELIDQKGLREELGVGHATVEAIFRQLPVVALPGHRKVFVQRGDVRRLLDEHTYRDGERVRPA
jgi:hypothetical protein